jgi:predicted 2-oxoglutarate/Fe(II)-dependent dioxygenase YbiX
MEPLNEADVRKRCEEIRLLWRSMSKENRAANVREAIYRAAYADGQRAGMERAARLTEQLRLCNIDQVLAEQQVARLREALTGYAECSDGCTCGDGWGHESAQQALRETGA